MVVPMPFYLKPCSGCGEETEVASTGDGEYLCNLCYRYGSGIPPLTLVTHNCSVCGEYRDCVRDSRTTRFLCRPCSAGMLPDPWAFYY